MEHTWHESKWHLYEIENHFAFLQGETDECTGIYGSYFMNVISRGIINLHCPQQSVAVLKEIYICVEIPQRQQVNKLLHLQEQRENLILS